MFQNLTRNITQAFRELTGRDKITPDMIDKGCESIEQALLEADAADEVVESILKDYREKALNTPIPPEAKQGDFLIKLFHDELVKILGKDDNFKLKLDKKPSVIMLAGLQGAGKTTFAAKLANHLRSETKKNVLLCSVDVYRPAAMDQLKTLAGQSNIDCFASTPEQTPLNIAQAALNQAKSNNYDVLIIDTAGRTSIDDAMMKECQQLETLLTPSERLFVLDSMTGQDAARTAKAFHQSLKLTGIVLTKTDSDTRGGAALSARKIVGKPIKFMSTGEKIDDLDLFQPERIAGQILGMGDIVSLMKQIEGKFNKESSIQLMKKITGNGEFDFNDFKMQFEQITSMGGMQSILSKMPMMGGMIDKLKDQLDETKFKPFIVLIDSMTATERAKPFLVMNIKSRQMRIIKGSGLPMSELKKLLSHFQKAQKMMGKIRGKRMDQSLEQLKQMMSQVNKDDH